jgi:DNA-binding HxlR family transcriptional regulator
VDGAGQPGEGYKLTPNRVTILRALALSGSIDDPGGHAVRTLQGHTGHRSPQSLSSALGGLEQVGLVRRRVANQRTYRIEAVLDRLTPTDRAALDLPSTAGVVSAEPPPRPSRAHDEFRLLHKQYALTKPRVEVLRALLVGGPIDDPNGHATRILMQRIGRTGFAATHSVVTGLVDAGLVRRTVRNRRVVHLEALPEALAVRDRQRLWSTTTFPADPVPTTPAAPAPPPPPAARTMPASTSRADAARDAELDDLRAELAVTRAELARYRLQLEIILAWAKRIPTFKAPPHAPTPRSSTSRRTTGHRRRPRRRGAAGVTDAGRCRFGRPGADPSSVPIRLPRRRRPRRPPRSILQASGLAGQRSMVLAPRSHPDPAPQAAPRPPADNRQLNQRLPTPRCPPCQAKANRSLPPATTTKTKSWCSRSLRIADLPVLPEAALRSGVTSGGLGSSTETAVS